MGLCWNISNIIPFSLLGVNQFRENVTTFSKVFHPLSDPCKKEIAKLRLEFSDSLKKKDVAWPLLDYVK